VVAGSHESDPTPPAAFPAPDSFPVFEHFSFLEVHPVKSARGNGVKQVRFPKLNPSFDPNVQQPVSRVAYPAPFSDNESLSSYLLRPGGLVQQLYEEVGFSFADLASTFADPDYDRKFGFTSRLRTASPFWQRVMKAPPELVADFGTGVSLPWVCAREEIPAIHIPNPISNFSYDELLSLNTMADRAVAMGVVQERSGPGRCNLGAFCVPKDPLNPDPLKRCRPILDGSPLSPFLRDLPFTLESLLDFIHALYAGDELVGSDVSDAYFLIAIDPADWEFLCFEIPDMQGRTRYLGYIALPQGLKPSAFYFERVMRVVRRCIASRTRLPVYGYLDDIRAVVRQRGDSESLALTNTEIVFGVLFLAGFPLSWKKSFVLPTLFTPITGYLLDTSGQSIFVEVLLKRWVKLRAIVEQILSAPLISCRLVARFGGGLQSCYIVLPRARLRLRGCFQLLLGADLWGWDGGFPLPPGHLSGSELVGWLAFLRGPPARRCIDTRPLIRLPALHDLFSDAGAQALGGALRPAWVSEDELSACLRAYEEGERSLVFHASESATSAGLELVTATNLHPDQFDNSSALRELRAILHNLLAFAVKIRHAAIRIFVDNQSLISILRYGSSIAECHLMALQIDDCIGALDLDPRIIWIPRCLNARADYFSHWVDYDDYFWSPESCSALCARWEFTPEVDLFATPANRQPICDKFVSHFFQPGCFTADALSLDWEEEFRRVLLFPPVSQVGLALTHLRRFNNLSALVVVPLFTQQPYMRVLFPDGRHFGENVKAYWFLERGVDIIRGPIGNPSFLQEPFRGHRYLFLAILWESSGHAGPVPRGGWARRSRFSHRFCLARHFNAQCSECTPQ